MAHKLRLFVILLMLIINPIISLAENSNNWHQLEIGFNLDYPDRVPLFESALFKIAELGIRHVYIYEIFDGKQGSQYQTRLKKALDSVLKHGMIPMICISNIHGRLQPEYEIKNLLNENLPFTVKKQINGILTYSNRYPPNNWQDYTASIQELVDFLFSTYGNETVQNWPFEIGNEPDASRFFWGNSSQFLKMYKLAEEVLSRNGIKIIGGFGLTHHSILINNKSELKNLHYHKLIEDIQCKSLSNKFISFHLFNRNVNSPLENYPEWLSNSHCPVMITGWNISSRSGKAAKTFNQPGAWGEAFIYLLADSAQFGITRLYIFNLMDYPALKDPQLGAFDRNSKSKSWYQDFIAIWKVIREGYSVIRNETSLIIIGKSNQSIVLSLSSGLSLNSTLIYSPYIEFSLDKMEPAQWAIISSTPNSNSL